MILIIDNYDSFTYNLYQAVALCGEDVRVIRNDKISIEEIESMNPNGIILSPGPGRPEDAGICIELILRLGEKIPILGVCLGHQAIGLAFGGKVVGAPSIVHGKADEIFHTRDDLFSTLPLPFTAGRYHSLLVESESLPESLLVDAETGDGLIMGMRHRNFPIYGVQFHPESILTPEGARLIGAFLNLCSKRSVRC